MSNEQVIDGTATEIPQAAASKPPVRRLPRRTLVVGAQRQ
ncbi:DNA-binding protein, partial [Methylobacterium sp. WL122]